MNICVRRGLPEPARLPRIEMLVGNPFFVIRDAMTSFGRTSWPCERMLAAELRLRWSAA
jgi:hypothetical protein